MSTISNNSENSAQLVGFFYETPHFQVFSMIESRPKRS